jgi:purine-binding chemotaxis protein CheW
MDQLESRQYLSFTLDGENYAVGIEKIHEVLEYTRITPLPGMDAFMKGIVNIRGVGIPVIDLRLRFGMPETPVCKDAAIIVMELENDGATAVVGALADAVHEVVELPASHMEPPPRFGSSLSADYVRGVARHDDGFIVVLDIDRVLQAEEYRLHAEVGDAASFDTAVAAEASG